MVRYLIGGMASLAIVVAAGVAIAANVVGGVTPSVRPAGDPTITKMEKSEAWFNWARRGVSAPYPSSLNFLADQGAWYTPFTQRNMPDRYDIRGLYSMPAQPDQAAMPVFKTTK